MIRVAKREDAEELLKIYSYYVENTAITFEYDVPSVEEFSDRISNTLKKISLFSFRGRRKNFRLYICREI